MKVELHDAKDANYRGHCIAALFDSDLSPDQVARLKRFLPNNVSYDQYVAFDGIINSDWPMHMIEKELSSLFGPLLMRYVERFREFFDF